MAVLSPLLCTGCQLAELWGAAQGVMSSSRREQLPLAQLSAELQHPQPHTPFSSYPVKRYLNPITRLKLWLLFPSSILLASRAEQSWAHLHLCHRSPRCKACPCAGTGTGHWHPRTACTCPARPGSTPCRNYLFL